MAPSEERTMIILPDGTSVVNRSAAKICLFTGGCELSRPGSFRRVQSHGRPDSRLREAISQRVRRPRGGDCFVALRAPRNDAECVARASQNLDAVRRVLRALLTEAP